VEPGARRVLGALAGGAALALGAWAFLIEPRRIVVSRRTLALPGWPRELAGLRVAVVADLHAGTPHVDEGTVAEVVAMVNDEGPDMVLLLGDYVDKEVAPADTSRAPLEAVVRHLAALHAPLGVHAVLGNHDWAAGGDSVVAALSDAGVNVLENDVRRLERDGQELWLIGLADLRRRDPDLQILERMPAGAPTLVMSHDPDVFPRIPRSVALTLSGHTHGSQVDLPLLRRLVIPSRYGARFASGHVVEGERHLFVSRGLGTTGLPVRFRARPEIPVLELR
jgi:uncharacterized protein